MIEKMIIIKKLIGIQKIISDELIKKPTSARIAIIVPNIVK
jgi:hypothetical protein